VLLGPDNLSRLRSIAERHWDAYDPSAASVTDPYLVSAVRQLEQGKCVTAVADYIVDAEIDCLGIDTGNGIRERAAELVRALKTQVQPKS
jgi:hypothetical protein